MNRRDYHSVVIEKESVPFANKLSWIQAELKVAEKAGAALAFGILFTPNAIVLTRDSVHPPTPTGEPRP